MLTPQNTGARAKSLKLSITLTAGDLKRLSDFVRVAGFEPSPDAWVLAAERPIWHDGLLCHRKRKLPARK